MLPPRGFPRWSCPDNVTPWHSIKSEHENENDSGQGSREAPVRTEPHPTCPGLPRGLIDNVTPWHPIKIENEDERDWGLKRGRGQRQTNQN